MSKDKLLKAIEEKYKKLGVPLDSMLEGLLWSTPITYWDYIQTDALLGLQIPRTDQPDEMVLLCTIKLMNCYSKWCYGKLIK